MKNVLSATLFALLFTACNPSDDTIKKKGSSIKTSGESIEADAGNGSWKGGFSNGMKGNKLSFDVEGNELKNLTFEGYWHCDGKLDLITVGPEKSFTIKGNKVAGVITEPEDGIAPFHFEIKGSFDGDKAEGTFKMENVQAGCTTYKLDWTAEKQ